MPVICSLEDALSPVAQDLVVAGGAEEVVRRRLAGAS